MWTLATATTASAQITGAPAAGYRREAGLPASAVPAALREIGFDQNLDHQLPLDLVFVDENGRSVRLSDFFGRKPVVLAFVYYDCPLLCTQVLNALAGAVDMLSLQPGTDFDLVAVSFDPREKPPLAAARKDAFLQRYKRAGGAAGTHFLTGEQAAIESLTKAAGFRFVWDERLKQFAHPTGIIVVTPAGRIARYLFGIDYGPRDLRLAIVEASAGRIGSAVDSFLLYCYHYDPMTGRYGLVIMRVLRVGAAGTVLALGLFVGLMLRREQRTRRHTRNPPPSTPHRHIAPGTSQAAPTRGAP